MYSNFDQGVMSHQDGEFIKNTHNKDISLKRITCTGIQLRTEATIQHTAEVKFL